MLYSSDGAAMFEELYQPASRERMEERTSGVLTHGWGLGSA